MPQRLQDRLVSIELFDPDMDTPFYWHIPKTAGTMLQDLLAGCLELTLACESGSLVDKGNSNPDHLALVTDGDRTYVNVDTQSMEGLEHAQSLDFASLQPADVVISSFLPKAAETLFNNVHRGMVFTLFRHPIERAYSLWWYLHDASWEETYAPELKNMTLKESVEKDIGVEWNWMTTLLTDDLLPKNASGMKRLALAKEIVRQRFLVGLVPSQERAQEDLLEESLERFGKVLRWDKNDGWQACLDYAVNHKSNSHKHPQIKPGSDDWELLRQHNELDLQLYDFAVALFREQGEKYFGNQDEDNT
jgi:hypothetical protein